MIKAVIDRFEDQHAVLLIGDDEQQIIISRQKLPDDAREGNWLLVEIQNGDIQKIEIDSIETAKRKERIANKLEKLKRGDHLKKC